MKYFIVCDYGDVYCFEVGVYVLFCNSVWCCVWVCCVFIVFFFSLWVCLCNGCVCVMDDVFCLICDVCSFDFFSVVVFLFRRICVVCLCPACILLQFLMLNFV